MRSFLLVVVLFCSGCSSLVSEPVPLDNELVAVRVDPDLVSSVANVDGVAISEVAYRETIEINGSFKRNLATGVVSLTMEPGFLRPQLAQFLSNHPRVQKIDNVIWRASDNYQWPSQFVVEGASFEHALHRVLEPYKLEALFRPNNIVVIQPKR